MSRTVAGRKGGVVRSSSTPPLRPSQEPNVTQPSSPPLSLAQFRAEQSSAHSSARGRLMAYMVLNNEGGQGAQKMLTEAPFHEVKTSVDSALGRIQAKRKKS